jgi:polysaccharide biosynthesis protein PelE
MTDFWQLLGVHVLISVLAATVTYLLLPRRYRLRRAWVFGLMFSFAFIAPVIGAVGLLLVVRLNQHRTDGNEGFSTPMTLGLPIYEAQVKDRRKGAGQGAIRSRLAPQVPSELRMQSLLTLQAVPNRVSNPILEELLGDNTDDVRLVAFGMLDAEEKKISSRIREVSERMNTQNPINAFDSLCQLAELYWELVYACLAQGELRKHILSQAADFADRALALQPESGSGLLFLRARIWMEQGNDASAKAAFEQALELGQPKASTLPYLAELALRQRDFPQVRRYMQDLSPMQLSSRTRGAQEFWTSSQEIKYSDRKLLQHI